MDPFKLGKRNTILILLCFGLLQISLFQNCAPVSYGKESQNENADDSGSVTEPVPSLPAEPATTTPPAVLPDPSAVLPPPSLLPPPPPPPAPPVLPPPPPTSAPLTAPQGRVEIEADAMSVREGQSANLKVLHENLENVALVCQDRVTKEILINTKVNQSGASFPLVIRQDVSCKASGQIIGTTQAISDVIDLSVDCQNRIKNSATNRCEDFSCKSVVQISERQLNDIPVRSSEGVCYAVKIMSRIANSPSNQTSILDNEVLSRNHDWGSQQQRNPYLMGSAHFEFKITGPRVVKLAGKLDSKSPILVDNFILMGLYPSQLPANTDLKSYYRVMGTSDSSLVINGVDSKSIRFRNNLVPVQPYGSGGTGSVAAIDLSRSVLPNQFYRLDIRALDCGGSRELSDIYLLFQ